ncbi:hypothetical protein SUGI_0147800 [Cryptomeria japonica]|nr:hypothetical protein SUGI_0147800 [Cryptomeria japonica]
MSLRNGPHARVPVGGHFYASFPSGRGYANWASVVKRGYGTTRSFVAPKHSQKDGFEADRRRKGFDDIVDGAAQGGLGGRFCSRPPAKCKGPTGVGNGGFPHRSE